MKVKPIHRSETSDANVNDSRMAKNPTASAMVTASDCGLLEAMPEQSRTLLSENMNPSFAEKRYI